MSAVAKASDPKGLKRVCASCGIRFYDLNKRPIACPNCATEFTGEIKVKTRRTRAVPDDAVIEKKGKKGAAASDDDDDVIIGDDDVVSLEDLEKDDEDGDDETPDADLDLDDGLEDEEVEDELEEDLDDLDGDIEVVQDDKAD